jgi:hypothetical protein
MIHYPKPARSETLQDWMDRTGTERDELRIVDSDPVTGEVRYAGFGWWGGRSCQGDENEDEE